MKSVSIRNFSVFGYGDLFRKYLALMRENTDQKNTGYEDFLRSDLNRLLLAAK